MSREDHDGARLRGCEGGGLRPAARRRYGLTGGEAGPAPSGMDRRSRTLGRLIHDLWRKVAQRRRVQLAMLLLLMVVSSAAEVLAIGAVMPLAAAILSRGRSTGAVSSVGVLDRLGLTGWGSLQSAALVFGGAAFLSGVLRLTLLWAHARLTLGIGADLAADAYRRTLYQPYAVHLSRNSNVVVSGIVTKVGGISGGVIGPILNMASGFVLTAAIMLFFAVTDPRMAGVALVGFGVTYLVVARAANRMLAASGEEISRQSVQVIRAIREGLGGIRDVIVDGTQEVHSRIFGDADLRLRTAQARTLVVASSPRYAIEAIGMMLIAAIALWQSSREDGLGTAIPMLAALALSGQRLLPTLQTAYAGWASLVAYRASLEDALELLDQPLPAGNGLDPLPFVREIRLRAVSFRYSDQAPWVLRGIDLTIPRGARVGIVGTTGGGKSTLLDLLMGLLCPTKGEVEVDGVPVTEANVRTWQSYVAHVPQAIFLSDATVAENIAFGVPMGLIDLERVAAVAEQAQLAQTIEAWPLGYRTHVGERGVRLSGGQRQRIGIARALYKRASVIVLDEATSALDGETESSVLRALDKMGRDVTFLVVAHRLSTLENCSRIVEIAAGTVAREGTYADLVRDGELVG